MGSLAGMRIVLTGASSGIGLELARLLGERGARLFLAARRGDRLAELAAELASAGHTPPQFEPVNLAERGRAAALAERALETLGGVDVLINNAASNLHGFPSAVGDRDEARELFEINFWQQMALVGAVVPAMRIQGHGQIVNVTSLAYVAPFPAVGHYCASKGALAVATQALRLEVERFGLSVLEVVLGPIDTPSSYENRLLEGGDKWIDRSRPGDRRKAARAIAHAIERRRNRLIYPRRLAIGYELPVFSRMYARSAARWVDPERTPIRRTGDLESEESVRVREDWERTRGALARHG